MTGKLIASTLFVLLSLTQFVAGQVSFSPAQSYSVGTAPVSVAVADLNRDGIPDLVVANQGSNNVSVLLGNGQGVFQQAINFDTGISPTGVIITDINGDGKLDIAALVSANLSLSTPGAVSMLLGNGNGTFQAPIVLTLTPDQTPFTLTDISGDKKADLIVNLTDSAGNPIGVTVSLGNGDGTFQTGVTVPNTSSVALVSDLNNDGKPDLVLNGFAPVQVMYSNGGGTFTSGLQVAPPDQFVIRIWAADVNGDGQLDLIVESSSESGPSNNDVVQHIGVFLKNGNTFGSEQIFLTGESIKPPFKPRVDCFITDVVTGDFNGDGKVDIANRAEPCSNPPFAVNISDGAGNFTVDSLTDPGPLAAAADLNGDQLADLVVLNAANKNIEVLLNSTPAFTMVPATNTLSASAGQQVTDTLTLSSINGFSAAIQLSCLVTGPTPLPVCSLSPNDVTPGTTPATTTLTLAPASSADLISPMKKWRWQGLCALALPLAFVGLGSWRGRPRSKCWLMIPLLGVTSFLYTACGQGSGNTQSAKDPKSYTVQVTAASATLTKNSNISLTVQ